MEEADIVLLGIPFDSTCVEIPGARFAPNRIREDFQVHMNNFDPQLGDLEEVKLHDAGNVEVLHGNVEKTNELIYETVKEIVDENPKAKLITLGGEHSVTYPIVKALYEKKKFDYLCYDAHTDLWDKYNELDKSHACVNRRIYEMMKNVEVVGYRTGEKEVYDFTRNLVKAKDPIYISVDVDVFSDKVGCPVSGYYDFEKMWNEIKNRDMVAADVVEYNPLIGKDIRVAELVKRLILSL